MLWQLHAKNQKSYMHWLLIIPEKTKFEQLLAEKLQTKHIIHVDLRTLCLWKNFTKKNQKSYTNGYFIKLEKTYFGPFCFNKPRTRFVKKKRVPSLFKLDNTLTLHKQEIPTSLSRVKLWTNRQKDREHYIRPFLCGWIQTEIYSTTFLRIITLASQQELIRVIIFQIKMNRTSLGLTCLLEKMGA